MPADSASAPSGEEGALGPRTVALSSRDHQYLLVRGFRDKDIKTAVNNLRGRCEINLGNVVSELSYDIVPQKNNIEKALEKIRKKTKNVAAAARFARWLCQEARDCRTSAATKLEQHYASLWPGREEIAVLIDQWPEVYRDDVRTIKRHWPTLQVNCDIGVDCSASFDVCTNQDVISFTSPQVSYPAFFKLIKDIWFEAIARNNRVYLNRVAHLLVSCAHVMSGDYWAGEKCGREYYHSFAITRQMQGGVETTEDVAALCFYALMHPPSWSEHKETLFAELFRRVLRERATCLAPYYHQWQATTGAGGAGLASEVAKQIEQQVIPEIIMLTHFLEAIDNYIREHRDPELYSNDGDSRRGPETDYFDSSTGQLEHTLWAPCWENTEPRQAVIDNLAVIYRASEYQQLFLTGPPDGRQANEVNWRTAVHKALSRSRGKFQTVIDSAFYKAIVQDVIEQRFADLTLRAMDFVYSRENSARQQAKLTFSLAGLEPQIDPDDHSVSYGELHYRLRKQAFRQLRQYKQYVESVLGTAIPIAVSRSQIDAILERFHQLPIEEKRYWKMSGSFAKGTLIPELVQDLLPGKMAQDCKELRERQKLFITCKCLTCTICNVDTYFCNCQTNVGYSLAWKFNRFAEAGMLARIEKDVRRYLEPRYCKEKFNIRLALVNKPAEVNNPDEARILRSLEKKGCNAHRTSDGKLCRKRHSLKPDDLCRRITREIFNRRIYNQKYFNNLRLRVEPAGGSAARHFYRAAGLPGYAVKQPDGARKWFAQHPDRKEQALRLLDNYPGLKPLIDRESLDFLPRSFQKIKCRVIYHDLDDFQEHLVKLRPTIRHPKLPLTSDTRGLYLHKTFCLCCRINFGHTRELQKHLDTHNDKMLAVFKEIDQLPLKPPAATPMDDPVQFLQDTTNKDLAASRLRLYQRDMDKQLEKRFWDLKVQPTQPCPPASDDASTTDSDNFSLE